MAARTFDEFVQRENYASQVLDHDVIDWNSRKDEWLRQLARLFAQVSEYLAPYVASGQVRISLRTITLNEEFIGVYSAPEMLITIGSKTTALEPVGANILLSKGRVDVVGPLARAQLLLLDTKSLHPPQLSESSEIELTWNLVSRPPQNRIELVTRESFLHLLQEISNG